MKKAIIAIFALAFCLATAGSALAATSVVYTRHNLGTGGVDTPGLNYTTDGTPNVCVFCHTPHGAQTFSTVSAPIWNKGTGAGNYTMYNGSPTFDTTIASNPTGVSLACLTCHDGTVALDTMMNAPGSNWRTTTPGSASRAVLSSGGNWTWTGGIDTDGSLMDTLVTNLGTDLSNDHPISMTYAGSVNGGAAFDPKFWNAATIGSNTNIAVVNGSFTGATNPTDGDIRLFNLNTGNGYEVQCASCHNPHGTDCGGTGDPPNVDGGLGAGVDTNDCEAKTGAYYTFLQRTHAASTLCRACHIK